MRIRVILGQYELTLPWASIGEFVGRQCLGYQPLGGSLDVRVAVVPSAKVLEQALLSGLRGYRSNPPNLSRTC